MSKYIYMTIPKSSPIFNKLCNYCDKKIVTENLSINGGTLNYSGIVFDSDIMIVCFDKTKPVAFNSLVELEDSIYIYQPTRYITIKTTEQQSRWSWGIQAGMGITPKGLQPYIGLGATFRF